MRLKDTWQSRRWPKIVAALLINAAFLAIMLTCYYPIFETNDDVLMSKFVDGQFSVKTAYVPFINIILGFALKMFYVIGGDSFNWYSFAQYSLCFLGFSAITWILLRRFRLFPALVMTGLIFAFIGTDCYQSMNFSKPAAVATVAGMALMLHGMQDEKGAFELLPIILGFVMAAVGFMWRFESFGICALIMAAVCIVQLLERWEKENGLDFKGHILSSLRYLSPFVLLAVTAAGLFVFNIWAWGRGEAGEYYKFDVTRSLLIDFYVPEYHEMPEVYDQLEMDENFVYMLKKWSFYDTEKMTQENMEKLIAVRDEFVPRKTIGECLGVFLDKCLHGFLLEKPVGAFLAMLVLWLACGSRRIKDWLSFLYMLGGFGAIYLFMIWSERYLANRMDMGLFLALAVVLTFLIKPERVQAEKLLLISVLCVSLYMSYRAIRPWCIFEEENRIEDKSKEKAAIERILEDEENLYFVKVWSIDHEMYTPLECAPAGYADKLVHIGGWSMHHPVIVDILESYDIENPYKDIVNHPNAYIIDEDIERTINYISRFYYPNAKAELIQPISTETNLKIYKITG